MIAENPHQRNRCRQGKNHFRRKLGVGKPIERKQPVEQVKGWNFQNDFPKEGKKNYIARMYIFFILIIRKY